MPCPFLTFKEFKTSVNTERVVELKLIHVRSGVSDFLLFRDTGSGTVGDTRTCNYCKVGC
jgi:hypothetical protein